MAVPIHFDEVDFILGPPGGQEEAAVPIPVRRLSDGRLVSCWKFSREELDEIARTGKVWLETKAGDGLQLQVPPVFVTGNKQHVLG